MRRFVLLALTVLLCMQPAFCAASTRLEKTVELDHCTLVFDCEVDMPASLNAQPLMVTGKQWDIPMLQNEFFPGQELTFEEHRTGLDKLTYIVSGGVISSINARGTLNYTRDEALRSLAYIRKAYTKLNMASEGFSWMTPQQAVDLVREKAIAIGLEPGEPFVFQALSQDTLNEFYDRSYANDLHKPSEYPKEGYWMRLPLMLKGVPCMRESYTSSLTKEEVDGSTLNAYVTQEGIGSFYTERYAYEVVEEGTQNQASIPLDKAMEVFEKKYRKIIKDKPVVVKRVAYEYVLVPIKKNQAQLKARPAWCFYIDGTGITFDGTDQTVYLDAITGKAIV